jgi:hypothetical protein
MRGGLAFKGVSFFFAMISRHNIMYCHVYHIDYLGGRHFRGISGICETLSSFKKKNCSNPRTLLHADCVSACNSVLGFEKFLFLNELSVSQISA